jgi:hypothetical protein
VVVVVVMMVVAVVVVEAAASVALAVPLDGIRTIQNYAYVLSVPYEIKNTRRPRDVKIVQVPFPQTNLY